MLTDDGRIFHIDFGWIMGKDPRPLPPEMRITSGMIDCIGGESDKKSYPLFKDLTKKVYNCARKHVNLFAVLLRTLSEASPAIEGNKFGFTREYFLDKMIERYQPGVPDDEAAVVLDKVFEGSKNAIQPTIIDWVRWNQDTPRQTVVTMVEIGKSVSSSIISYAFSFIGGAQEKEPQ